MASKKIEIDVVVNGKMEKATVSAKKLRGALDDVESGQKKTGKGAGQLDRNLKGTAQATSNTTKEFAKMSQGMGGLVAVYAQIAAATFAVSAAFQFMKDSMEVRNLMEGQKAFGAVTGVAYQTLTKDIRAATDGMLSFRDAAQAAAIGTAAGLSRGQLEQLGAAAKNVSFALGRDLTDSFNRLVRGVTKAEPELLDELGIILRLDPALKAYSVAIGKNVKDLNQFEKSQAIANEVLTQAEQKFGAIQKIMDPNAAALAQFQQSFTDLMDSFKAGLADSLIPVFNFLKDNTASLLGALSLVALPIIRQILPNFEAMGEAANKSYMKASKAALAAKADAEKFAATSALAAGGAGARAGIMESSAARGKAIGIDVKGKLAEDGMLSKRQLNIYRKLLNDKERMRKRFTAKERVEFRAFMAEQEALHATSEGKKVGITKQAEMAKRTLWAQSVAAYKAGQAAMIGATEKASKGMNKLMKGAGFIGLALLVFDIGRMLYEWAFPMTEAEKKAQKLKDELKGAVDTQMTLNDELGRMIKVADSFDINLGINERITQKQQALQSVDVNKLMIDYNTLGKGNEEYAKTLANTANNLAMLTGNNLFNKLADTMESQGDIAQETSENLLEYTNGVIQAGIAISQLTELQKATNAAFQSAAPSGLQFSGLATAVKAELDARELIVEEHIKTLDLEQKRYDSLDFNSMEGDKARIQQLQTWMDNQRKKFKEQGRTITEEEGGMISLSGGQAVDRQRISRSTYESGYNQAATEVAELTSKLSELDKAQKALTDAKTADTKVQSDNNGEIDKLRGIYNDILSIQARGLNLKKRGVAEDVKLERLKSNGLLSEIDKEKQKLQIEQDKRVIAVENAQLQLDVANLGAKNIGTNVKDLMLKKQTNAVLSEQEKAVIASIELARQQLGLAEARRDVGEDLLDVEKKLLDIKESRQVLELADLEAQLNKAKALLGATSVQKRSIEREAKMVQLQLKKAEFMLDFQEKMTTAVKERDENAVAGLLLQLEILNQQEEALRRQADDALAIADTMKEAFQSGFEEGLAGLIKGTETSLTDVILQIGKGIAESAADEFAKRMTEKLFKKPGDEPEDRIKNAMIQAAEYHANAIRAAISGAPLPAPPVGGPSGGGTTGGGAGGGGTTAFGQSIRSNFNGLLGNSEADIAQGKGNKQFTGSWKQFTQSFGNVFDSNAKGGFVEKLGNAFKDGGFVLSDIFTGFLGGFSSLLSRVFSGSSSGGYLSMIVSSAFGAWAGTLGSGTTGGGSGGGSGGGFGQEVPTGQPVWTRYGGVIGASGKMMPGYAMGGIASGPQGGYPVTMHGTEAVVPLPNNRSIPVEMKGGGSQQNNVTVNVTLNDAGGSSETSNSNGQRGDRIGDVIANAVKKELQNQKRQGGMLSPNGV